MSITNTGTFIRKMTEGYVESVLRSWDEEDERRFGGIGQELAEYRRKAAEADQPKQPVLEAAREYASSGHHGKSLKICDDYIRLKEREAELAKEIAEFEARHFNI